MDEKERTHEVGSNTTPNIEVSDVILPASDKDFDETYAVYKKQDAREIEAARVAVIEDTHALRLLMLGPMDYLTSFTHDELISMQAISRFDIAQAVPLNGEASFAEIGLSCGLSEGDVKRILRHATVKSIFAEPRPGFIAHNAVSKLLAENETLNDWVGASTDELWQAASQTVNAMAKWKGSEEPTETVSTMELS